jgi:class 3 adenylate cyclase
MMNYTNNNSGQNLTIKIGIHTGRIIAGVIGYHKP